MTSRTFRASAVFVALAATTSACLLAPASTATAVTTIEAAGSAVGFGSNWVTTLPGIGDLTKDLTAAAKVAGSATQAHVIHLTGGSGVTVAEIVRPANYVYLVAESGTRITWRGASTNLLRFASDAGRVTGGVYGGTWDGAGRGKTNLIHLGNADVRLAELKVSHSGQNGIGAYKNSSLTVSNVIVSNNDNAGVFVAESSSLTASGLRSTNNERNGVQLSSGSVGRIANSILDSNGQAVRGSTDGEKGHGLGVAASTAFVSGTSMSRNKVCGASLTDDASVEISGNSHLDNNGRHGLGTEAGVTATISDSFLNHNGYNGALASGKGTTIILQHVTIDWAKKMALSVPSGGSARVTGSLITRGQKYSISVSTKGKLSLLGGNTISASRSHGITVSGKGSITFSGAGNLVTGSRGDGLRITGSGTKGWIYASASFLNNPDSGIVVAKKAKLWMVKCQISGNKYNNKPEKRSGGKWYSL